MKPTEKLEKLNQLAKNIQQAVSELESDRNVDFFKSLIQSKAIEIYELANSYQPNEVAVKPIPSIETKELKVEVPIVKPEPILTESKKITEPITEPVNDPIPEPKKEPETAILEPIQIEKTKPLLSNQDDEDAELSINEKISKNKTHVLNVVEKSSETPIKDITKSISISKKFEFINGLFDGNADAYKTCLNTIQNTEKLEQAYQYLESEITEKYQWNDNEKLSDEFFSLTRRKFL